MNGVRSILMAAALATTALARPPAGPEQQMRRLRAAGALLVDLDLTQAQAAQLLALVNRATAARQQVLDQIGTSQERSLASYQALKAQLVAQQPTREAEQAAQHAHLAVKHLNEQAMTDTILRHEQELDRLLTADQVAFLIAYDGKDKTKIEEARRNPARTRSQAAELVDRLRRMDRYAFSRQKEAVYRHFIENCTEQGLYARDAIDFDAALARVLPVMTELRALNVLQYAERKQELARALCPHRTAARPALYGWKYVRGEPLRQAGRSSRLLFSEFAAEILAKMAD